MSVALSRKSVVLWSERAEKLIRMARRRLLAGRRKVPGRQGGLAGTRCVGLLGAVAQASAEIDRHEYFVSREFGREISTRNLRMGQAGAFQ